MKNNANIAPRSCLGPRSNSTRPGNRNSADKVCALRMRCDRPNVYSSSAMAISTQPSTGRGEATDESSMRSQDRQISQRQITSTITPWLCSCVDQMLTARSQTVGT